MSATALIGRMSAAIERLTSRLDELEGDCESMSTFRYLRWERRRMLEAGRLDEVIRKGDPDTIRALDRADRRAVFERMAGSGVLWAMATDDPGEWLEDLHPTARDQVEVRISDLPGRVAVSGLAPGSTTQSERYTELTQRQVETLQSVGIQEGGDRAPSLQRINGVFALRMPPLDETQTFTRAVFDVVVSIDAELRHFLDLGWIQSRGLTRDELESYQLEQWAGIPHYARATLPRLGTTPIEPPQAIAIANEPIATYREHDPTDPTSVLCAAMALGFADDEPSTPTAAPIKTRRKRATKKER